MSLAQLRHIQAEHRNRTVPLANPQDAEQYGRCRREQRSCGGYAPPAGGYTALLAVAAAV